MFHCGYGHEMRGFKTLSLSFKREQLLYDIGNCAFVEGDVMEAKDEHQRHPVIDVTQDGNVDRVTRTLDLAFAETVEMLYPYAKEPVAEGDINDELTETEVYVVAMTVPEDFSQTTVRLVSKMIHEYLVCRVLQDWLSITDKPAAQDWATKAESAAEGIRSNLNARRGRVRRGQHPF